MVATRTGEDGLPHNAEKTIQLEADKLAKEFELDPERVCRVLERTIRCNVEGAGQDKATDEREGNAGGAPAPDLTRYVPWSIEHLLKEQGVAFWPDLRKACDSMPPRRALSLFEEHLCEVRQADFLLEYLHNRPHFRTLDEIESETEYYIGYLERNREHLVKTGLPHTMSMSCDWLAAFLSHLYSVRTPVECTPVDYDDWSDICFSYDWAGGTRQGYDAAPIIEGLALAEAARLESIRPRLFGLKVDILQMLLRSVRRRDWSSLRADCLSILRRALSFDDVGFCVRMDLFYGQQESDLAIRRSGGLVPLLMCVGNYEVQIRLEWGARMRRVLGELVALDSEGKLSLTVGTYDAMSRPKPRAILRDAWDVFLPLHTQEEAISRDFFNWLRNGVVQGLLKRVTVSEHVPLKQVADYRQIMHDVSRLVRAQQAVDGKLPDLDVSRLGIRLIEKGNVFEREGDYWRVAYDGKSAMLRDSKGLQCIHYLVEHQGSRFRADVLSRAGEGVVPSEAPSTYARMTREELAREDLSVDRAPLESEREAAESLTLYKSKIEELDAEIEEAERCHDMGKLEELNRTRDGLISLISSEYDVKDRPRETSDPHKAARQRISTNIKRALHQIKGEHPSLYEHLDSALEKGTFFSYSPKPATTWTT